MPTRLFWRRTTLALFTVAVATLLAGPANAQIPTAGEAKCSKGLAKGAQKLYATIIKETAKCRDSDISGKTPDANDCDPLPTKSADKVGKAFDKLVATANKSCASTCSVSEDIPCVQDLDCPPSGNFAQTCGGTKPFSMRNLGFPGPNCAALLGHEVVDSTDIGTCVALMAESVAATALANTYGTLNETSGLSAESAKCLASVGKTLAKSPAKIAGVTAKCRDAITKGSQKTAAEIQSGGGNQSTKDAAIKGENVLRLKNSDLCAIRDAKAQGSIDKEIDAIGSKLLAKACLPSSVDPLGLCDGVGTAQDCLETLIAELGESPLHPASRTYSKFNLIDAAYPETAVASCGDGLVNRGRSTTNTVGEECEAEDTSACGGGGCFAPGDIFECTCDNVPRLRLNVKGTGSDSDAGWTGDAQNAAHVDNQGWTADLTDCNCTGTTGGTCTTPGGDNVCNTAAATAEICSGGVNDGASCDLVGNINGTHENNDCHSCDANSLNSGNYCEDEGDCNSQCRTSGGTLTGTPCSQQSDCGASEQCVGRCDETPTCDVLLEGAPLPLIAADNPACIELRYRSDIVGTKNIVTGDEEVFYDTSTITHIGGTSVEPCPRCAGTCENDPTKSCLGTCDTTGTRCLSFADCGVGDTVCDATDTNNECTGGSTCELSVPLCSGGDSAGRACQPTANSPFGIMSEDCRPAASTRLSGEVLQFFNPMTTASADFTALPETACTEPAYSLLDCRCNGPGSKPSQPNACSKACVGGANDGGPCNDFTRCVGGDNANKICDEDADCAPGGGTCSSATLRNQCTAGAVGKPCLLSFGPSYCDSFDGAGDGDCGFNVADACPDGRCLPSCVQEGRCVGGGYPGTRCGSDFECACRNAPGCTFPGTCDFGLGDPEEGACANGPSRFICLGPNGGGTCLASAEGTTVGCEDVTPGAGICGTSARGCFVNDGFAEGDPDATNTDMVATWCGPTSGDSAIDNISGFPGGGRLRKTGTATINMGSF